MELTANQFPSEIHEICQKFSSSGYKAFVVGGSIRDLLRGETRPNDWDIATDASPTDVITLFKQYRVIPTGIQHGTVTLLFKKLSIEITTFRVEGEYKDGRRPSEVQFVTSIEEDLARRDLTINAIAYDPVSARFTDPFDGRSDITNNILRLVGDPDSRLEEDGLRLIRIFRFVSQLGYSVEKLSLAAVPKHLHIFDLVAKERIETEFNKLIAGPFWKRAVKFLFTTNLIGHLIPEYTHESMQKSLPPQNLSRLEISLQILNDLSTESSVNLRYIALFHQLSAIPANTSLLLPDLDKKFLTRVLKNLKFPNKRVDEILHFHTIHKIPFPYTLSSDDNKHKNYSIRRLLYNINPKCLNDYLLFHRTKAKIFGVKPPPTEALIEDIKRRSESQTPIYLKNLKIDGNSVVAYLKINKAKSAQRELIGICLDLLREQVEVNPSHNTQKALKAILDQIKNVKDMCTGSKVPRINIVSTDHVRKLYCVKKPTYASWESTHTYKLAIWLVSCLLRRDKSNFVIFDGTNFNSSSHPHHREKIIKQFKAFNPIFVHTNSSKQDLNLNLVARSQEKESIAKSDADITIHQRYEALMDSYPDSLRVPSRSKAIELSTRSEDYEHKMKDLTQMITKEHCRLIIMSGNVLTGKTFTANKIKQQLMDCY